MCPIIMDHPVYCSEQNENLLIAISLSGNQEMSNSRLGRLYLILFLTVAHVDQILPDVTF